MSNRRQIPRFTPDPPPDIGNPQTVEELTEALWTVIEYQRRQNDRLHDWWPRDADERLAALESLQGFTPVEMNIAVDIGVQFFAEAKTGNLLVCGGVTTLSDDEYGAYTSDVGFNAGYSPDTGRVYIAPPSSRTEAPLYWIDTSDDSYGVHTLGGGVYSLGFMLYSTSGSMTTKDKFLLLYSPNSYSQRAFAAFDLGPPITSLGGAALTVWESYRALCENTTHILLKGGAARFTSITKSSLSAASNTFNSTDYSHNESFAFANSDTTFLICLKKISTGQYFLTEYNGAGAVPDPSIAIAADIVKFDANAVRANNYGFWPVTRQIDGVPYPHILVTDLDGATVATVQVLSQSYGWVPAGLDRLFVDAAEEYIYFLINPYVGRINTTTFEVETCQIAPVAGIPGLAYSGLVPTSPDGVMYLSDFSTRAGTTMFLGNVQVTT